MARPYVNWTLLGEIVGGVGGLMTLTAVAIGHPAWRWIARQWTRFRSMGRSARIEAIVTRLDKAIYPNGGASVVDRLGRIEDSLEIASATARATFRAQPGLAWLALPSGDQIDATEDLVRLSGRTAEELRGNGWRATIHPADRDRLVGGYLQALAMGIEFEDRAVFMIRVGKRSAIEVPCRITAEPSRLGGKIVAYIGRLYPEVSTDELRAATAEALEHESHDADPRHWRKLRPKETP